MADDNTTVSMAQQALTGVNGGASVPTPEVSMVVEGPGASVQNQEKVGNLLKSAFGHDQPGLAVSEKDGTSVTGMSNNAMKVAMAVINQLQSGGVKNIAGNVLSLLSGQGSHGLNIDGSSLRDAYSNLIGGVQDTTRQPKPIPSPQPQPAPSTTYQYGGYDVELPEGIDPNDTEAVNAAMASQNAIIDLINQPENEPEGL